MNYLATLKPAQILVIKDGKDASNVDLLKSTLLDLLLKQVLKIEKSTRQASANDPIVTYNYVAIGPAFSSYKYDEYEEVFLSPFLKHNTLQVLFRKLVIIGYENAYKNASFKDRIVKSHDIKPFVKRNILQKLIGGFTLTDAGLQAKTEINRQLAYTEEKLLTADGTSRVELLKPLFGNILLLQGLPEGVFAEFDDVIGKEFYEKEESTDSGCGIWIGVDSYSDGFDSGCSSHGSDGGGDSGCSGCSGCGSGCGGCGGGGD
jgi:hypothetical protein